MSQPEREAHVSEARRMAGRRFVGMLLMAAGGLLALLCGLCTAVFSVGFIVSATDGRYPTQLSPLLLPLIIGGVPTAAGVTLFWVGLNIFRDGRRRRGHPEREFD